MKKGVNFPITFDTENCPLLHFNIYKYTSGCIQIYTYIYINISFTNRKNAWHAEQINGFDLPHPNFAEVMKNIFINNL